MSTEARKPTTQTYLLAAALLLALPLASYLVGLANAPRPMSLTMTRDAIDRDGMRGDVLLDQVPAALANTPAANMEDKLEVLGMTVDKEKAVQGSTVEFTFYYRALTKIDEDWQVFGHIDGINNVYRIHADHFPASGRYTTDLWQQGEIIADRYKKTVPLDAPSGRYDVWIGFYIGDNRLKLKNPDQVTSDGSNRIKVGQFTVGL